MGKEKNRPTLFPLLFKGLEMKRNLIILLFVICILFSVEAQAQAQMQQQQAAPAEGAAPPGMA